MDLQRIGKFLKVLRKEKGLTQEQLSERVNVSSRTVSRWETGHNLPDLDILIMLSTYYDVELRELFDGERKGEKMNKALEETVVKVADYSGQEKMRLMKKLHVFSWIGVVSFVIFIGLEVFGTTNQGILEAVSDFCLGISFGMLVIAVIYTSKHIHKINAFKKRIHTRQ